MNLRATFWNSDASRTFSTRREKEVEGSFRTSGDPIRSKRSRMADGDTSFFERNSVGGMATPCFFKWQYMLILSEQIWIDEGSSITGMPLELAVREAT